MPSDLMRSRRASAAADAAHRPTAEVWPPQSPPAASAPSADTDDGSSVPVTDRRVAPSARWTRRLVIVAGSGVLCGGGLAAALALGGPLGPRSGLRAVVAATLVLAVATATPIGVLLIRAWRADRRHHLDAAGIAGPQQTPLAATAAPDPAATTGTRLLTDRADLVAACEAALGNRDVVGGGVALVVLDLVGLDAVREALGPTGLDDVTRQTVRRLRAWLPPQDSVARLGATTFAVLLEGLGHEGPDPQLARVLALLGEPMSGAGRHIEVEFAVGVAVAEPDDDGTRLLLEALRATAADAARRAGRTASSPSVAANPSIAPTRTSTPTPPAPTSPASSPPTPSAEGRPAPGRSDVELARTAEALAAALRGGGPHVVFRPVVRLDDPDRLIAIQALPRWSAPGGPDLTTAQLETLAAHLGMTAELDHHLLERGLDAVASWYAAGFAVGRLAIRFGQDDLVDPTLSDRVGAHLARRQLPGTCLVAEVDAAAVADGAAARPVLADLRSHGIEVVLTGVVAPQAALGLLHVLPLSGISLHRALVARLTGRSAAATAALTGAHQLGLRVIAEDVGMPAQLSTLRECGVDAAWGSAVSAPARARDISARFSAARTLMLRN